MELTDFLTWEYLATFAGCSLCTALFTQGLKNMVKIPTQVLAWIIAVVLLELAQVFTGTMSISTAVLAVLNGFVVATATSGTIDLASRVVGASNEPKG